MTDKPEDAFWVWGGIPEKKIYDKEDPRRHDDIAEEYVIEQREEAEAGIVVWAKYHGKWQPNPFSSRPVIAKLLSELETTVAAPKRAE